MPEYIRALIVVIVLALFAFYAGRQVAIGNISPREFKVWRNVWFIATVAGFLAGNFYIYAFIVAMLVLYARAEGTLDPALYLLLLFVVPPIQVTIGGFGMINKLMEFSNPGLLAALVLLPVLVSTRSAEKRSNGAGQVADLLIVAYVLLMIALQFRTSEVTNVMRMAIVYALNILLPYFALSRAVTTTADMRKVLVAFVLAVFPLCLIGVFETLKGWSLYSAAAYELAGYAGGGYLRREGILRAMATATQPIALGFVIMVAWGCFLALQQTGLKQNTARLGFALLGAGLIATLSRGPWVGAAALIVVYLATGPNAATKLAKLAVIGIICLGPLLLTPVGARLLNFLPFIGSVDTANVEYRQRLLTNSLIVAERNFWFGSVDYQSTPEMQEMIQGEGIIDVVNSYLKVVLDSGVVGLTLFIGFFASILLALWRALRSTPSSDTELRSLLRASMATMVAILVTIGTVSSISYLPHVYWSFAGLSVALIRIAHAQRVTATHEFSPSKVAA